MPEAKKHTYESSSLGLPPLKMVLVHSRNDAQNAAVRPRADAAVTPSEAGADTPLDKEKAIRRLIEHLEMSD